MAGEADFGVGEKTADAAMQVVIGAQAALNRELEMARHEAQQLRRHWTGKGQLAWERAVGKLWQQWELVGQEFGKVGDKFDQQQRDNTQLNERGADAGTQLERHFDINTRLA
ncbi:hypothetical protein [Asanoa siamensis]|uniref:WXG100 family type VII secretion target n=1 Tax=Asanoa siamensis TaxID=926357 RepID=A0ABQ4CR64_9ACTN|nr:hypothetical protein [Asanoa siamensis]GIF73786.1 hypothetical protein Asi02nite_33040 [Asanoa siamensis]